MKRNILAALPLAAMLLSGATAASAQTGSSGWAVINTYNVGGEGAWDYLTVSSPRLFVPRSTHTQVLDENSGKLLGDIPGQKTAHGVAVVPSVGRGFITDGGGSGGIVVFDLKSYAVLGTIPAVPDADGIIYDAKLDRVLAVSGDGGVLMTFSPNIDPKNGKVNFIQLGGKPEFLASDGTGRVYINLADKDVVAVVDLSGGKVIARWPVAPGGSPVGLSLDAAGHRLFIGCRKPQRLVVMNSDTGKVEGAVPIGPGVDATIASSGQGFASSSDGTLAIVGQKGSDWELVDTVKTPPGARTMGMDPSAQRIFLPTADLEPAATGRPHPKPGTFKIVVVGHK